MSQNLISLPSIFFSGANSLLNFGGVSFLWDWWTPNPMKNREALSKSESRFSKQNNTHTIHVWYIYLHLGWFFIVNVGKYTSPMDAMEHVFPASNLQHGIFRHFFGVSNPSLMDTLRMKIQRGRYLPGTPLDPGRLVHYLEVQDT